MEKKKTGVISYFLASGDSKSWLLLKCNVVSSHENEMRSAVGCMSGVLCACNASVDTCKDRLNTDVSCTGSCTCPAASVRTCINLPTVSPRRGSCWSDTGPPGGRAEWCVCRLSVMNGEPRKIFLITYKKRVQRADIHTCKWRPLTGERITARLTAFSEPKVWEELFPLERNTHRFNRRMFNMLYKTTVFCISRGIMFDH